MHETPDVLCFTNGGTKPLPKASLRSLTRKGRNLKNSVVIFFHAEAEDEANRERVLQKFRKINKMDAGKFSTKSVVLHSFNHLSSSKSSPEFAEALLEEVKERSSGQVRGHSEPFGVLQ